MLSTVVDFISIHASIRYPRCNSAHNRAHFSITFVSDRAPASKSPTWQPQYTQQYPNASNHKPRKITHIQTPGGYTIETAKTIRTPLVAQALLPALCCPELFPMKNRAASLKSTTTEPTRKIQTRAALLASRRSEYTGQLWTNANSITEHLLRRARQSPTGRAHENS